MATPSNNLVGLTLSTGWIVKDVISKHPTATGGYFSTGYIVQKNKQTAFLKALDFSEAFQHPDVPRRLQELTEAYNFERDILKKCQGKRLDKVVTALEDGSIDVPGFPNPICRVYYLIFDLASGDIRKIKDLFGRIDLAFIFRSLHNAAVGLKQLHTNEIAHQDIKPSNILVFKDESKISDMGRASDKTISFRYDEYIIPGDRNYAPIEQRYNYHFSHDFSERYAADLYLFGSLFYFHFLGISAAQSLIDKCRRMNVVITDSFENDLPALIHAFNTSLQDLTQAVSIVTNAKDREEIVSMIKSLCYPDPRKRGYPKNVETGVSQYSLERYISRLDYFAKKAEYKML